MDRPEWIAVHPFTHEVYVSLTNNKYREQINIANPRKHNKYGHIIKFKDIKDIGININNKYNTIDKFIWDIFIVAGDIKQGKTQDNIKFNSPDSLAFDKHGILWIATDGNISSKGDFLEHGNNQLLCANVYTKELKRFLVGPKGCEITGINF